MNGIELSRRFASLSGRNITPLDQMLTAYLSEYFRHEELPSVSLREYDSDILLRLPVLIREAWVELNDGTLPLVERYRDEFRAATKKPTFPDLGAIDCPDTILAGQVIESLYTVISEATGNTRLAHYVAAFLNAERNTAALHFNMFTLCAFRRGLYDLIQGETCPGMRGSFGITELRSFVKDERCMLAFVHRRQNKAVTFAGWQNDPYGTTFGLRSATAPIADVLALIADVIEYWPEMPEETHRHLAADQTVVIE